MSLGGPAAPKRGRRLVAVIAAVAVIALAAAGYMALREGGEGGGEDMLAERLRSLRSTLDLMMIEYGEAVENGSVRLESEYQVALSLARRAAEIYNEVERELANIDREASARLGELVYEILEMVEAREDPDLVQERVTEALETIDYLIASSG